MTLSPRRRARTLLATVFCGILPLLAGVFVTAPPASAAALVEVKAFGANPSGLRMYLYVPERLPERPAVLVAAHYCGGSGPAFHLGSEFASLADLHGFLVVYPSVTRESRCFDVSSPQALRRGGGSDPAGVRAMVAYVERVHGADPGRVFVTGLSSGAMLTNVLLGVYPDVFRAGAAFAGVPFGCFATTDGSGWNADCAQGRVEATAPAWGERVREAFPGYEGERPRMQLWHGTDDEVLRYPNFVQEIRQWTDVLGVSRIPERTDRPRDDWERYRYGGSGERAPVEAIAMRGTDHGLLSPGMAGMAIAFFGLDEAPVGAD
ncbi:alpha/beta hydrolase family esterase [Streptomyces radicis]|uniref:Esterase n=1 Tax=Streptomyces radicis TaxID=1750517 RepID=A0A3A9WWJ9_9ACTN|nr:PHB depolymerase family esterase [Streptomyces radicis]RKN10547.1 esterase [Streptomyces radicis]RKN24807.1 esterase [Streptomyces radicis]